MKGCLVTVWLVAIGGRSSRRYTSPSTGRAIPHSRALPPPTAFWSTCFPSSPAFVLPPPASALLLSLVSPPRLRHTPPRPLCRAHSPPSTNVYLLSKSRLACLRASILSGAPSRRRAWTSTLTWFSMPRLRSTGTLPSRWQRPAPRTTPPSVRRCVVCACGLRTSFTSHIPSSVSSPCGRILV